MSDKSVTAKSGGKKAGKKRSARSAPEFAAAEFLPGQVSRTAEQIASTPGGVRSIPGLTTTVVRAEPAVKTAELPNGLRVIAVRKAGTPLVEVRLRVPFGGDSVAHTARAEMLAATILLGTSRRTREDVDAELALFGGHLDANVDPQRFLVSGSVLSHGLSALLEILADSLTDPAFRAHDVAGERDRIIEYLAISASQPATVARERLQHRRFGSHPASREMPTVAAVSKVGSTALRASWRESLVPNGSTLVLVGDLVPAKAIAAVAEALALWHAAGKAKILATPPEIVGGNVRAFHRDGAVQSQVRLTAAAVDRTHPDYPALQLANLIYGGYFSSRLVENLREDKGYTYSARSTLEFWPGRTALTVAFDTNTDSTAPALLEARYELGRIALVAPGEAEVESARNYALGTLATSLASQAGFASTVSSLAGLGLGIDWLRRHPARLAAVSPAEVARVAARVLAPVNFTGVVVGDLHSIGTALKSVGAVEVP